MDDSGTIALEAVHKVECLKEEEERTWGCAASGSGQASRVPKMHY